MSFANALIAKGWLPDRVIRMGIRHQLRNRLKKLKQSATEGFQEKWIETLKKSPVTVMADLANEQHYEVPSDFFRLALGRHMKYSCGDWTDQKADLDESEAAMLRLTVQRVEVADGQQILELGCGWGSLSLFLARRFPKTQITAVSNSRTQKDWIDGVAKNEDLNNLCVVTADIAHFDISQRFDRIISVEMLEHVRNYEILFERIAGWLKPDGKMFAHIFCHRDYSYPFDPDPSSWMATYFFSGGIMPSENLFMRFSRHLRLCKTWKVSGLNYHRTCEAWLKRTDSSKRAILKIFEKTYGAEKARQWFYYWRVFFLACSELFRFEHGNEWFVGHYLFEKKDKS